MSRLEIVKELSNEFKIDLVSGYLNYATIQQNNLHKKEHDVQRLHAIHRIAKDWSMSIELATESYDLAHGEQTEKG